MFCNLNKKTLFDIMGFGLDKPFATIDFGRAAAALSTVPL